MATALTRSPQPIKAPLPNVPSDHATLTDATDYTFVNPAIGIYCGVAGTATLTMNGHAELYTMVAGVTYWGQFTALTAGTATKLTAYFA